MTGPCITCSEPDCAHLIRVLADYLGELMTDEPHPDNPARPAQFGPDLWDDVKRFAAEDASTEGVIVREAVRQYANARNRAAAEVRLTHNHYGGNVCTRRCPAWKAS